jgi:hypothetical protein
VPLQFAPCVFSFSSPSSTHILRAPRAPRRILGPKKQLWVATYPVEARESTAHELEAMLDIPCQTLPNFLNLTLTPSNQVGGWMEA